MVDFEDITAVVEKFQSDPDAPIKSRADLINSNVTDPEPDRIVDFLDVTLCVEAFRGFPEGNSYPGPNLDDLDCPRYVGDCYADIRVDSNNDGEIDDFDDAVEETSTMFLVVNSDDDDSGEPDFNEAPVVGADDLAEIQLTAACDDVLPELAWWSLSWDPPDAPVKVWFDPDKSGDEVVNGFNYEDYWPPPESVWLESLETFDDVEITFTFDPGTASLRMFPSSGGPTEDRTKVRCSCTQSPHPKKRYWIEANDWEYESEVTGASAELLTPTTWTEPLCNAPGGLTAVLVLIIGSDPTLYPPEPIWGQIGYTVYRNKGNRFTKRGVISEIKYGATAWHWRKWYQPMRVAPGEWHHYWVEHCGDCCQNVTTYLDGEEFDDWDDEIFCEHGFFGARWYGELEYLEDKLCGTASDPCTFDNCKIWIDWIPEPFNAHIEEALYVPSAPGSSAWGIWVPDLPFGDYGLIWDKKRNE